MDVVIRMGSKEEMRKLWGCTGSNTEAYFMEGIEKGNMEFWTIENQETKSLIGELYIVWNSEDKDEADGRERAYLCAFRVEKAFQGLGLGKRLMERVLRRVREMGFTQVTIGADNDDAERLTAIYKSWGFSQLIKLQHLDHHYLDKNNNPVFYKEPYRLYLNNLIS